MPTPPKSKSPYSKAQGAACTKRRRAARARGQQLDPVQALLLKRQLDQAGPTADRTVPVEVNTRGESGRGREGRGEGGRPACPPPCLQGGCSKCARRGVGVGVADRVYAGRPRQVHAVHCWCQLATVTQVAAVNGVGLTPLQLRFDAS